MSTEIVYRTEKKFLLPEIQLHRLESKVRLLCTSDSHSDAEGKYEVRSLYFDSPDYQCYSECKAGVDNRKKYRIRTYNCSADVINLECKTGLHGKKHKDLIRLTEEELNGILDGGTFPINDSDRKELSEDANVLSAEFDLKLKQGYRPTVVVAYTRSAFVYPVGNVRITIDRDIRALPEKALFDDSLGGMPVLLSGKAILEVKYDDVLPQAIKDIFAEENELRRVSFSKYAVCVDALRGNMVDLFEIFN